MNSRNEDEALVFLQQEQPTEVRKPDITWLPDAFDLQGEPVFVVGDKIVIEYYNTVTKNRKYLHTRIYTVKMMDEETGDMKLFDEAYHQSAFSNYKKIKEHGDIIKMFAAGFRVD